MSKHILVISQCFYPEQFRINDICCALVKRGYKVTVITGIPNYPQGKFYDGYGWFKKRKETWNGMEIIRLPLIARGKSKIGMVLNYLSFVVSGAIWSLFTPIKADCVFGFETSPMTQALLGVWYSKKRKVPNYLYVQDLWPENVQVVAGINNKYVIGAISKMVAYIYKNCDKILATSPSFVTEIQKRVEEKKEKVIYWPQYAEEFYQPTEKNDIEGIPCDEAFKIVFTGNIGYAQGLNILPETAKILKEKNIFDVRFIIVGDGRYKEQLIEKISDYGLQDYFIFTGRVPAEKIPSYLAFCDAAFISFMNNSLFQWTIPAKLQSYMACAMPIVAAAEGETARIVKEAECGVHSPVDNADALAENIIQLKNSGNLNLMAENSRKYFVDNFEKEKLMDFLVETVINCDSKNI